MNTTSSVGASPEPEANDRDRQIWWALVAVGVVVFIALIFFGRPLVEGRLTAARNLDRATATIGETDGALRSIDRAVKASPSTQTPGESAEALAVVRATQAKLEEASALSQDGYDRLTTDEQRRATIVKAMATARIDALIAAETALSTDGSVREQALRDYAQAVERVRQADAALVKL